MMNCCAILYRPGRIFLPLYSFRSCQLITSTMSLAKTLFGSDPTGLAGKSTKRHSYSDRGQLLIYKKISIDLQKEDH